MKIRHRIRKYGRKWIKLAVIDCGWYNEKSWKKWKATDLDKNGQNTSKMNGNE